MRRFHQRLDGMGASPTIEADILCTDTRKIAASMHEDWNDSTLSSDIQKLRIQNKSEATIGREQALAYAFSK